MKIYSVLIAVDNGAWREMLRRELRRYSYFGEVNTVSTGREAVEYLELQTPDILVIDLALRDKDGIEAIRHLRSRLKRHDTLIFVMAGAFPDDILVQLKALDVTGKVIKPMEPRTVAYHLYRHLVPDLMEEDLLRTMKPLEELQESIEEFLYQLGAPLYKRSCNSLKLALYLCVLNPNRVKKVLQLYESVAGVIEGEVSRYAVDQNIRRTIRAMQQSNTVFFRECFKYGHLQITNAEFLNVAVSILQQPQWSKSLDQITVPAKKGAEKNKEKEDEDSSSRKVTV